MVLIVGGAFQGKPEYARAHYDATYEIMYDYQEQVRMQLLDGKNPQEEARAFLQENAGKKLVVLLDEVGCGIVPIDGFERQWREEVGRCGCILAEGAEEVIRVVCGCGTKIK